MTNWDASLISPAMLPLILRSALVLGVVVVAWLVFVLLNARRARHSRSTGDGGHPLYRT